MPTNGHPNTEFAVGGANMKFQDLSGQTINSWTAKVFVSRNDIGKCVAMPMRLRNTKCTFS